MQVQIQVLLTGTGVEVAVAKGSNTRFNVEIAKPLVFNEKFSKVIGFIMVYKLYLRMMRMKMSGVSVKEQIQ